MVETLARFFGGDDELHGHLQATLPTMARSMLVGLAVVVMAALRFTHLGILWVEEAYPMAAAQQLLRGRVLYRDVWFDKPPASPGFTPCGARKANSRCACLVLPLC